MYRVLIRYSFNGDDGTVTTDFWNSLAALGFLDAGTGLKRAASLSPAQLQAFFQAAASRAHGAVTGKGSAVGVDHFIIVVESI